MGRFLITEFDIVFLSFDEPNAERHFSLLVDLCPWAKRVHGVKGFDAAHRACAEQSETEFLITVDADNIVRSDFFDLSVELTDHINCVSWNGLNAINGLSYGNGGLKLWRKSYLETLSTHELSDDPTAIDFCWEQGYQNAHRTYSDVWTNGSPYQAFRVGFREGVKLALDRGRRVAPEMMASTLHPVNLRNLRIWASVGSHVENGLWAIYGARLGWLKTCDPLWDHSVVRDYDWFQELWGQECLAPDIQQRSIDLGQQIGTRTKIMLPLLMRDESAFFQDMMAHRND